MEFTAQHKANSMYLYLHTVLFSLVFLDLFLTALHEKITYVYVLFYFCFTFLYTNNYVFSSSSQRSANRSVFISSMSSVLI